MERQDPPLPPSTFTIAAALKSSGELRDGLLVLGSALYLAGYLVWAVYAGVHQLGAVPVLDAQYFAAGALPIFVVLVLIRAILWVNRLSGQHPTKRRSRAGSAAILGGIVLFLVGFKLQHYDLAIAVFAVALSSVGMVLLGDRASRHIDRRFAAASLVFGAFMSVTVYAVTIFPRLPAEFGGPAPKCVELDLQVEDMASDTINELAARPWEVQNPKTVNGALQAQSGATDKAQGPRSFRTRELYLVGYFNGYAVVARTMYHSDMLDVLQGVSRIRLEAVKAIHHTQLCPRLANPK